MQLHRTPRSTNNPSRVAIASWISKSKCTPTIYALSKLRLNRGQRSFMVLYNFDNIHDSLQLAWSITFVYSRFSISDLSDFYLKVNDRYEVEIMTKKKWKNQNICSQTLYWGS